MKKILVLLLGWAAFASAQTPGPTGPRGPRGYQGSRGYRGQTGLTAPVVTTGPGLISIVTPGLPQQLNLDTTIAVEWVSPPAGPGPCSGSSLMAVDPLLNLYACVPAPALVVGTAWVLQTITTPGGLTITMSPVVSNATQSQYPIGATSITLAGMAPNGTYLVGDSFGLDGTTYTVTSTGGSDATGNATFSINPPLTLAANAGDSAIVLTTPPNPWVWARTALQVLWPPGQ